MALTAATPTAPSISPLNVRRLRHPLRAARLDYRAAKPSQPIGVRLRNELEAETRTAEVNGTVFRVDLEPGAGAMLRITMRRYTNKPSYSFPWRSLERTR